MAIVGLEPSVKDGQRFTQREAAAILGLAERTIRYYVAMGLMMPGRKIGRCTYYYGRDIKRCWRNFFNQ